MLFNTLVFDCITIIGGKLLHCPMPTLEVMVKLPDAPDMPPVNLWIIFLCTINRAGCKANWFLCAIQVDSTAPMPYGLASQANFKGNFCVEMCQDLI